MTAAARPSSVISAGSAGVARLASGIAQLGGRARPSSLSTLLALGALAVALAGLVVAYVLWAGQRFAPPPVSFMSGPFANATQFGMGIAYAGVGALLAARQPRNPIGWLFLGTGLIVSAGLPTNFLVAGQQATFRGPSPAVLTAAWVASSFNLPAVGALAILVFLLFPDGRAPSRRWSIVGWLAVGGALLVATGLALEPTGLIWYPSLPNPMALPASMAPVTRGLQLVGLVAMLGGVVGSAAAMVIRYHRAAGVDRPALKLIAAAVLLLAALGGPLLVARYGLAVGSRTGEPLLVATIVAASLLPVAAALGVLRYRLFDIDLILNHALVYVPLTGFLGGLYAASVALFQRIFVAVTGDTSDVAIILTTLILAGTFTPVRKSLEGFVDRRFKPLDASRPKGVVAGNRGHGGDSHADADTIAALADQLRALEARLAEVEQRPRQGAAKS